MTAAAGNGCEPDRLRPRGGVDRDGEAARVAARHARHRHRHRRQPRARGPQLLAVLGVRAREEEPAAGGGEEVGAPRGVADGVGPDRRPVALPEAAAGGEDERPVHVREVGRIRAGGSLGDVLHEHGARGGAVALPELDAVRGVGRTEVERPAGGGQVVRRCRGVRDGHGAPARAVTPPEPPAVRAVVRGEVERAADVGEVGRARPGEALVDVAHDRRARLRPVASPQLPPPQAVVGREEERPGRVERRRDVREVGRIGGAAAEGVDVGDQLGAAAAPVRPPELATVDAVVGGEVEPAVGGGRPLGAGAVRELVVPGLEGGRVDVLDERRAAFGPVCLPELVAVEAVVGGEVDRAGEGREPLQDRAADEDLDARRAGLGAVRPPELGDAAELERLEEERSVHRRRGGGPGNRPGDGLAREVARADPARAS